MERLQKKIQGYSQFEKTLLLFVVILAIVSFVLFICLMVNTNDGPVCYSSECINAAYHVINTVDDTIDPCEDFYKFSCGNFLKEAITKDQISPLKLLADKKKNGLQQIVIEELENEENLTNSFRNQRKYYKTCMNITAIEEDKGQTFLQVLKNVTGGWPLSQGYTENVHWSKVMIRAREHGVRFDFFLDVDIIVGENNSAEYLEVVPPENNFDEYLWNESNLQKIMEMVDYWGGDINSSSASWEFQKTIEFAKNLKEIVKKAHSETRNQTLEEKKTAIRELKYLSFLKLDWLHFLKKMTNLENLTEHDVIIFGVGGNYLKDLYYLMQRTQTKIWINYVVLLLITDDYRYLSNKIQTICKQILRPSTYTSRREYCFHISKIPFKGVAEAEYIRRLVTEEKRRHIQELIKNIKKELNISLKTNKWMDKETKELANKQLKNITEAIGWTDIVFDEDKFDKKFGFDKLNLESDNIIEITQTLTKFYYDSMFSKVGRNISNYVDMHLNLPILDINAMYVKYANVLILLAPLLHQHIYALNQPEYMNYGALGSIIGHELTHALSKLEKDEVFGKNSEYFWSNETQENYEILKECFVEEYENYTAGLSGKFSNASETLSENLADFTGINLAYRAYQKWIYQHGTEERLPGLKYTPNQLFWIMASTYMCLEPKLEDDPEKLQMEKHAVSSFRIIGPIRNAQYFAKDFGCPENSKMNPKNKCHLF